MHRIRLQFIIATLIAVFCFGTADAAKYGQTFETLLTSQRAGGVTLSGGKVQFVTPGAAPGTMAAPTNLKAIYTDRNKTTPAANPVTLDSDGRAQVFGDGLYDIYLYNSAGVTKAAWEDVSLKDNGGFFTYQLSDYGTWQAAVTAIGSTAAGLTIDDNTTISADVTVPSNIHIIAVPGKITTIATGKVLTINGTFQAGRHQVFSGSGTVTMSIIDAVFPEWWGAKADGLDATAAVNTAAITASLRTKRPISLATGTYVHNGITIEDLVTDDYDGVKITGQGFYKTILKCIAPGAHGLYFKAAPIALPTFTYFQYITLRDFSITGNGSNGNGIYSDGLVWFTFERLYILNNGGHGIHLTGGRSSYGSYIGVVRDCKIANNVGDGVHQVGIGGTNQQNATWYENNEIQGNANGMVIFGTHIVVQNNVIEGNDGIGILVGNPDTQTTSSSSLKTIIDNNYFEINPTAHIKVIAGSAAFTGFSHDTIIVDLSITNNFMGNVTGTGAITEIPVVFSCDSRNQIKHLIYENNKSSASLGASYTNELSLCAGVGSDSRVIMSPSISSNDTYATFKSNFAKVINPSEAKVDPGFKTHVLNGYLTAKGGSGVTYATPGAKSNTCVTGASTYFPLSLPAGSNILKMAIPVETDATNYTITFLIYSKNIEGTAAASALITATTAALSGSTLAESLGTASYISNPVSSFTSGANMFMRVLITITTPGTYFYLGDPVIFYN